MGRAERGLAGQMGLSLSLCSLAVEWASVPSLNLCFLTCDTGVGSLVSKVQGSHCNLCAVMWRLVPGRRECDDIELDYACTHTDTHTHTVARCMHRHSQVRAKSFLLCGHVTCTDV